jgi:hypothetical protein
MLVAEENDVVESPVLLKPAKLKPDGSTVMVAVTLVYPGALTVNVVLPTFWP